MSTKPASRSMGCLQSGNCPFLRILSPSVKNVKLGTMPLKRFVRHRKARFKRLVEWLYLYLSECVVMCEYCDKDLREICEHYKKETMPAKKIKRRKKGGAITYEEMHELRERERKAIQNQEVRFVKTDDFPPTWKGVKC